MKISHSTLLVLALVAILPVIAQDATSTSPSVPTYPNDFVGSPEFNTTAGRQSAGTASVIKLKEGTQSYIVSARHLLGPMGGFKTQTAAADVPSFVKSIRILSFAGGSQHYDVTGLLIQTKRLKAEAGEPGIDDMAIYQNNDTTDQSQAVALSDQVPAMGAPVWVVAHVAGGVPKEQIMQSAKITNTAKWIIFQFDNDSIVTAGASGAQVPNAAGEVIGVYSGHSAKDGHVFGFAIPAQMIAATIKAAAATPPAQ